MDRIGTMTVIRGNGGVRLTMDGVMEKEVTRQKEEYEKELKRIEERHAKEIEKLNSKIEYQEWYINELEQNSRKFLRQRLDMYSRTFTKKTIKRNMVHKILACMVGIIR